MYVLSSCLLITHYTVHCIYWWRKQGKFVWTNCSVQYRYTSKI